MIYRCILPNWAKDEFPELPKVVEGEFTQSKVRELNDAFYNIYYLPNYPSVYNKNTTVDGSHIDNFVYVFVDMDLKDGVYPTVEAFLEVVSQFSLFPTKVVASGNGAHVYWKVSDLDGIGFLKLQRRLCRHFNTDEAVGKIYQLMRVIGTVNTKDLTALKVCELLEENNNVYTSEQLDHNLPILTREDEEYCNNHYQKTYELTTDDIEVDEILPHKFGALLHSSSEVKEIWKGEIDDRSKGDYRLGHLMFANSFTKDEAMSVLVNSAKALARAPKHRVNYAANIVDKIWTYELEPENEELDLSMSVKQILQQSGAALKGTRFPCYKWLDDTKHGFRLGQVMGLVAGSGVGKCMGKDTPILMFDGTVKKVQDVKPGDKLMGPDSKERNVLSTVVGQSEMFRVSQNNGDSYIVNDEHILSLKVADKKDKNTVGGYVCGSVLNISIKDYLKQTSNTKRYLYGYKVPVSFEQKNLPIDPYFFGLWLGDGTSSKPDITIGNKETEILKFCDMYAHLSDLVMRVSDECENHNTYTFKGKEPKYSYFLQNLKKLRVFKNKHIPTQYLTSNDEDRLRLLAGIIDSDGSVSNKCFDIVQKSKSLSDGIVFLARSLGFRVTIQETKKECVNNGVWGDYYRITISGDTGRVPTLLPRKQCSLREQIKDPLLTSINVESIGQGDYYGFTLDGDHLYLLGDFTVTHNTAVALNMFMGWVALNPNYEHFFIPLEQPANEIADRWKTLCAGNEALYEKVHVISNYDADNNFRHLSFDEIKDYLLKFQRVTGKKVGCVVIDHIGALKKKGKDGENQDLMDICHSMKAFAVQTNTMLIMQSQAPREKAGIGDLELNKDAAYGTVYFEAYCDYLVTLWQPLKRSYDKPKCPTVTAIKFCKIRHKNVKEDVIKEDVRYTLMFDPSTEKLRTMTQDEEKSFDFFNQQSTNERKKDKKTDLLTYTSVKDTNGTTDQNHQKSG